MRTALWCMGSLRGSQERQKITGMTFPLKIVPSAVDQDTLVWLEQSILECSHMVDYKDNEGIWKDAGTVAHIKHWEWDDPKADKIKQALTNILEPIIGSFVSIKSHILDSKLPWDVHNDYVIECSQSNLIPYCVVMIPLQTTPAKTIFFNQGAEYMEFSRYQEENPPIADHVSQDAWNSMLSHCRIKDRFWLSIDKVYDWNRGDICVWDRRTWHSSDNFKANNLESKRAIILFTSYPEFIKI